jgi:hypothetical protein
VLAILFVPLFFVLIARRSRPPEIRPETADADEDARAEEEELARAAAARKGVAHA